MAELVEMMKLYCIGGNILAANSVMGNSLIPLMTQVSCMVSGGHLQPGSHKVLLCIQSVWQHTDTLSRRIGEMATSGNPISIVIIISNY